MANHEIVPGSAFTKGTAERRKSATSLSLPGFACNGTYRANFVIVFSCFEQGPCRDGESTTAADGKGEPSSRKRINTCERKPAARRIPDERHITWLGAMGDEPAIGGRRRKRMLRRKPIVDTQHSCAGRVGDAPGKITKQRRKAEQIGAAVQAQDVSVGKRAGPGDTRGSDTAGINCNHLGAAWRTRHETPEARQLPADILKLNVRWKPSHEPGQAQADKLGAQTHLLNPRECGSDGLPCAVRRTKSLMALHAFD